MRDLFVYLQHSLNRGRSGNEDESQRHRADFTLGTRHSG